MEFLNDLSKARVLVVGDVMLDRYWWGTVSRISPEAPVPIVRLSNSSLAAGGAANVAVNIAGLGATPILIGIVGRDTESSLLRQILKEKAVSPDYLIEFVDRPTTVKTRIIAHSQQVARVDQEIDDGLTDNQASTVVDTICQAIESADVVAISDYAKGLLTSEVLSSVFEICQKHSRETLVDPKGKDYAKYRGASVVTPNRREAAEACNIEENRPDAVEYAGKRLLDEHQFGSVLITRGEEGVTLFQNGSEPIHFEAMARSVYDVTGAGDTVIATLASSIAAGAQLADAARLANVAAGLVVEKVGTTAVSIAELRSALNGE
ncbi:MAG TPA: D-glycero-beta-D-manno-heptose-7-phosphate kinase [Pyrinomonadaceae bacterium]|nr:D-glycero-beta-D-manno-heptose-7-phosphate kinase [Pyrinomonadaceae bacterium]